MLINILKGAGVVISCKHTSWAMTQLEQDVSGALPKKKIKRNKKMLVKVLRVHNHRD